MAAKQSRSIKIYEQSGYQYKPTPTIILKGQWLRELGFEIGEYISVSCENGRLIITPDEGRAAFPVWQNRCQRKMIFLVVYNRPHTERI